MQTPPPEHPIRNPPWHPCGAGHVAVYGTLRAGGVNDIARLQPGISCLGRSLLTGTLFDLGWYPGLQLQGSGLVLAEVYPLNDALEQAMDRIEGIWPQDVGEYTKRVLTLDVKLADGEQQPLEALVYEALPPALQGRTQISAQDWLAWIAEQGRDHPHTAFSLNTPQS
ncbi:gamma-glutamylcyclotransferase family protein [Comamonas squillarum]|uniref:Gamma-glutamylcyclotransferase n=1 Tax=Comamonas squillarum TaxID=2977320 RepID=A0ABY5ZZV0_9BURK|nr:gamma-glutamylcyclotransferase family protein [Comamonas sp. PR12]UXC18195.1 gamma-glutamylcyclotransferase [Comamonas sp. PR12]